MMAIMMMVSNEKQIPKKFLSLLLKSLFFLKEHRIINKLEPADFEAKLLIEYKIYHVPHARI